MEFGARRAQGYDASVEGARCAVIAGCIGTSILSLAIKTTFLSQERLLIRTSKCIHQNMKHS